MTIPQCYGSFLVYHILGGVRIALSNPKIAEWTLHLIPIIYIIFTVLSGSFLHSSHLKGKSCSGVFLVGIQEKGGRSWLTQNIKNSNPQTK